MAKKGVSAMIIAIIFILAGVMLLYGSSYISNFFFPDASNFLASKIQCVNCLFKHSFSDCKALLSLCK